MQHNSLTHINNNQVNKLGFIDKQGAAHWWSSWLWNPVYNITTLIDKELVNKGEWSNLNPMQKMEIVRNTLLKAVQLVITGQATNVESVLRNTISQVEKQDNWDEWKSKNPDFVVMMNRAQYEVKTIRNMQKLIAQGKDISLSSRNTQFQYISQNDLDSFLKPRTATAQFKTGNQSISTASFGSGIINTIKQNPVPSAIAGLGLIIGIVVFASSGHNNNKLQTKQLQ